MLLRLSPALVLLLASGCAQMPFTGYGTSSEYTEAELRDDLTDFVGRFSATVTGAAEDISARTHSRTVRRRSLLWRLRVIPLMHDLAFQDDPRSAFVDILGVTTSMKLYLVEGDGRESFGESQPLAIAAANEVHDQALEIGPRFLDAGEMERLTEEVERIARRYPIRGPDFSVRSVESALAVADEMSSFDWVVRIPMSPFRALEGVSDAALAVREVNETATELAHILDQLPRQNRWQIELLLYDIEDRDTVIQGLAAFEQMAASIDRVSQALARLPEDLRVGLEDSRGALAEASATLGQARELMTPIQATVDQLAVIAERLAEMRGSRDPDAEPSRPFDIVEYRETAESMTATVEQLRALLEDFQGLSAADALDGIIIQTVTRTQDELEVLVDRVTWRAGQLLLGVFVLGLLYRFLAPRLAARGGVQTP